MNSLTLKSVIMASSITLFGCGADDSGSEDKSPSLTGQLPTDSIDSAARSGLLISSGVNAGMVGWLGTQTSLGSTETDESDPRNFALAKSASYSLPCTSGGQMQLSGNEESKAVTIDYVQCMDTDGSYMNGSMKLAVSGDGSTQATMSTQYDAFSMTQQDGDSVYLDGDLLIKITPNNTEGGLISITSGYFESRVTQSGETESIVLQEYGMNLAPYQQGGFTFGYDFYLTADEGVFHIWTDGNLVMNLNNAGQTGVLYIEGANAKMTVTLTNTDGVPMANIVLDTDKDGKADLTGQVEQSVFFADDEITAVVH